jgi:hypothetical protein
MKLLITCFLISIWFFDCTGNTVFNDEISSLDGYSFHGRVKVFDSRNAGQIYTWLEEFDVGAWTDSTGYFEIELPPAGTQSGGGLTGEFRIYYYIANYGLQYSSIYVEKGKLQYGKLSLDEKGSIRGEISLSKILEITTHTDSIIYSEYSGHLTINISLKNLIDTVGVEYLSIYEKTFDGLFLRADTARVDQSIPISYSEIKKSFAITKPTKLIMTLWVSEYLFEPGNYYMIPYVYVMQKDLPLPLLRSITEQYNTFGNEYLKLPYRRNDGILKVFKEKPKEFD